MQRPNPSQKLLPIDLFKQQSANTNKEAENYDSGPKKVNSSQPNTRRGATTPMEREKSPILDSSSSNSYGFRDRESSLASNRENVKLLEEIPKLDDPPNVADSLEEESFNPVLHYQNLHLTVKRSNHNSSQESRKKSLQASDTLADSIYEPQLQETSLEWTIGASQLYNIGSFPDTVSFK